MDALPLLKNVLDGYASLAYISSNHLTSIILRVVIHKDDFAAILRVILGEKTVQSQWQ
jgi:hypothetical protein